MVSVPVELSHMEQQIWSQLRYRNCPPEQSELFGNDEYERNQQVLELVGKIMRYVYDNETDPPLSGWRKPGTFPERAARSVSQFDLHDIEF
jgi:hypothetical protein